MDEFRTRSLQAQIRYRVNRQIGGSWSDYVAAMRASTRITLTPGSSTWSPGSSTWWEEMYAMEDSESLGNLRGRVRHVLSSDEDDER